MKKIKRVFIVVAAIAVFFSVQPAKAFLGFGDIVFDPSVFLQTVFSYLTEVETTMNEAAQLENQIQSLYNEALNLAKMDQGLSGTALSGLKNSLNQLTNLQGKIRGMTMTYEDVEGAWDKLYKDFGSLNGKSGKEYAEQAQKVLDQMNNATYDAMRSQGLVSQLGDDSKNLQGLLQASNSASGALAAAQAGNQIAASTVQQLMRLQQISAASYRAESSYQAAQAQKEGMSKADSKRFFGDHVDRPLQGQGKGRATKQF